MRRSDETTASCGFINTHSTHGFKRSLTEVLGEHILSTLSLTMASIANHRNRHTTLNLVIREDLFKAIRKTEEVRIGGKSSLKHTRSNSYLLRLLHQGRAVKITLELMRSESRLTGIHVQAPILGRRGLLDEVIAVLLWRILIECHRVFKVIFEVGLLRLIQQSPVVFRAKSLLICRLKFVRWTLINASLDPSSQTLSSIFGVSLAEGILTLHTRDEASITRDLLRTDIVEWPIDPSSGVTAKITHSDTCFTLL